MWGLRVFSRSCRKMISWWLYHQNKTGWPTQATEGLKGNCNVQIFFIWINKQNLLHKPGKNSSNSNIISLFYPFPAYICWELDKLFIKRNQHTFLKWKNIIFWPHFDMSRGVFGLPGKNKNESLHKLTVVMCCQICDRRSVAPSSGDFRRRLQVTARAGAAGGGVAAW